MRPAALLLLALSACTPSCPAGTSRSLRAELLFGAVPPDAWHSFLAGSVTPRFPAGLTVLDGDGQWTAPDGRLTREASRVLLVVTKPGPASLAALDAIRQAFKDRFAQHAVGLVLTESCAGF